MTFRALAITLFALPLLAACQAPPLQIRPVGTSLAGAQMGVEREDADYASARAAIERRDYADALDWLQSARARNPNDIRVLNAFGVVYDKLGRFDLSTRYYQQALAIDRSSEIVAHNLAYSQGLQTRIVASPTSWELADIQPLRDVRAAARTAVASAGPNSSPVGFPVGSGPRPRHLLTVVNATGIPGGEQPVFARLVDLKWSLSKRQIKAAPATPTTLIRYAPTFRAEAVALARTLPGRPQLVTADKDETGVRLVLGADAARWKLRPASRS